MTITRHLDDATLMSFAAGSLPAALAAVAAAHVAMCPRCRQEVAFLERVGGALLADLPEVAVSGPEPAMPPFGGPRGAPAPAGEVPAPLIGLLGSDLDAVCWRWVSRGRWVHGLPIVGSGQLHMFRCAPGVLIPEHGHQGSELTLVLRGTLADVTGRYGPGDVCDLDEETEHTPAAGADGCVCVVGQDNPVHWRSLVVRLARPWHGM